MDNDSAAFKNGPTSALKPPRLMGQVHAAVRRRYFSQRTEEAYSYRQILVRDGKGEKDRVTMLPDRLVEPLRAHLARVRALHAADLREGFGEVHLPYALARKYPRAGREWCWHRVAPPAA